MGELVDHSANSKVNDNKFIGGFIAIEIDIVHYNTYTVSTKKRPPKHV